APWPYSSDWMFRLRPLLSASLAQTAHLCGKARRKANRPRSFKALINWRADITLVGIEACPLSEWLYGALVESGFQIVCIETRHAQRFLSSRPNKTDRSDARGIAEMMRLGHYRPVHVKSREAQLLRTTLIARRKFVIHMLAIEQTIRGLLKVYGLKLGRVHRCAFAAKVLAL